MSETTPSERPPQSAPEPGGNRRQSLADLPEVAEWKRKRRRWLIGLGICGIVGCFTAKPVYHFGKQWRCRTLSEKSIKLTADGKLDEAFDLARAGNLLWPAEPASLRAVGKVLAAKGEMAQSLTYWVELLKLPQATDADRRETAEVALQAGVNAIAAEQVELLLAKDSHSSANHIIAARLNAAKGDLRTAMTEADLAVQLDPSEDSLLLRANLLVVSAERMTEGRQQLERLAEKDTQVGLKALMVLAALPNVNPESGSRLAERLQKHPLAQQANWLAGLAVQIQSTPEKRSELLDAAKVKYVALGQEALRQYGSWLLTHGESERVLTLYSNEEFLSRKDILLLQLDAMAGLKQWRELLDLLSIQRLPLEPPLVELFRARCWAELHEPEKAELSWRASVSSAGSDTNMLAYIAGYAERSGAVSAARRAYRKLSENPKTARPAFEALLKTTTRTETRETRDIISGMARRWPEDTAIVNDLAYLNALLGEDVEAMRPRILELVRAYPDRLPHRTTLALLEVRLNRPTEALRVYQGLNVDWEHAPASAVVVYATALQANGRVTEATKLVRDLKAPTLRAEEEDLRQKILSTVP